MSKPVPTASEQKKLAELRALLRAANRAFQRADYFDFPPELHRLPGLIEDLQGLAGRRLRVRRPFWKCVVALDNAMGDLGLKRTIEELFARVNDVPAGPVVNLLKRPDCDASERRAVALLEQMIDPVLRDIDGRVTAVREVEITTENLHACSNVLKEDKGAKVHQFSETALKCGKAGADLFNHAAFWELACRSLHWRVRYLPALIELTKLGAALQHAPLFHQLRQVIVVGFPTDKEIQALRKLLKNDRTRERVRRHQERTRSPKA
jgi:hypothetical protein